MSHAHKSHAGELIFTRPIASFKGSRFLKMARNGEVDLLLEELARVPLAERRNLLEDKNSWLSIIQETLASVRMEPYLSKAKVMVEKYSLVDDALLEKRVLAIVKNSYHLKLVTNFRPKSKWRGVLGQALIYNYSEEDKERAVIAWELAKSATILKYQKSLPPIASVFSASDYSGREITESKDHSANPTFWFFFYFRLLSYLREQNQWDALGTFTKEDYLESLNWAQEKTQKYPDHTPEKYRLEHTRALIETSINKDRKVSFNLIHTDSNRVEHIAGECFEHSCTNIYNDQFDTDCLSPEPIISVRDMQLSG